MKMLRGSGDEALQDPADGRLCIATRDGRVVALGE